MDSIFPNETSENQMNINGSNQLNQSMTNINVNHDTLTKDKSGGSGGSGGKAEKSVNFKTYISYYDHNNNNNGIRYTNHNNNNNNNNNAIGNNSKRLKATFLTSDNTSEASGVSAGSTALEARPEVFNGANNNTENENENENENEENNNGNNNNIITPMTMTSMTSETAAMQDIYQNINLNHRLNINSLNISENETENDDNENKTDVSNNNSTDTLGPLPNSGTNMMNNNSFNSSHNRQQNNRFLDVRGGGGNNSNNNSSSHLFEPSQTGTITGSFSQLFLADTGELSNTLFLDLNNRNDGQCMVCLELFKKGDRIGKLVCGHLFHKTCVFKWLKKNPTCPYCRTSVERFANVPFL